MKTNHPLPLLLIASTLIAAPAFAATLVTARFTNGQGNGIWERNANLGNPGAPGNWDTLAFPNNGNTVQDPQSGVFFPAPDPRYSVVLDVATPVTLSVGARIDALTVAMGATLNFGAGGDLGVLLSPIQNNGLMNFGTSSILSGTLIHNSIINLQSNSSGSVPERAGLALGAGSILKSGSQIVMGNNAGNQITAVADGDTVTIENGATVRGAGRLNFGFATAYMNLINRGLIEANQPTPLTIAVREDINGRLTNTGILRARGDSTLLLRGQQFTAAVGMVNNAGGTIEAIENGTVRVNGQVTVTGGTLVTSGNGTFRSEGPGLAGGTFKDLTNAGTIAIADGENLGLAGTITNNGLVRLDGAGSSSGTALLMRGNVTLAGTGLVSMNGTNPSLAGGDMPGQTVTVGPAMTIRGQGLIGINNSNFLTKVINVANQGLIDATGPLSVFVSSFENSKVTNTSTLRASGGGLLRFSGIGTVLNTGGIVEALDGSTVRVLNGVTLEGGTVMTSGTGAIRGNVPSSAGGTFKDVTNTGTMLIGDAENFGLAGTFTNNGLLQLDSIGSNSGTALLMRGDVTLAGTGLVAMNGTNPVLAGGDMPGQTVTVGPALTRVKPCGFLGLIVEPQARADVAGHGLLVTDERSVPVGECLQVTSRSSGTAECMVARAGRKVAATISTNAICWTASM